MKVYLELPTKSRGIGRVYDALIQFKSANVEITKNPSEADLTILHVIGRKEHTQAEIERVRARGKPYAMIQYCLRSTINPNTKEWIDMWQGSRMVWSYYYLPELCFEDGLRDAHFPFYYAPLGVDPTVFYDRKSEKGHNVCVIATCSQHALSESAKECIVAAKRVNRKVFHLGNELRRGPDVFCKTNLSDDQVAYYYSLCEFVSGLRRTEGFELPVIEGLLCGARPIVFDRPHYRAWFDGLAVFIPELTRVETTDILEGVFRRGALPVTEEEKAIAKERFNWETIISEFWKRII